MTLYTGLALTLLLGVPLMLLAVGVIANAVLLMGRRDADPTDVELEALATQSAGELVVHLQQSVEEMRGQLARQRSTLESLLFDVDRSTRATASSAAAARSSAAAPAIGAVPDSTTDLPRVVDRLVSEGLSDRTIARRLRIGVEEVRLARARIGSPT